MLIPQLGLRLIRRHQLHGGIGHGIGGMHVPAGDRMGLVAEQAGDGRLAIAEIGGKTGKAVAHHVWPDVGWKPTELRDPQPHLPVADDRRLARSAGEHHIAGRCQVQWPLGAGTEPFLRSRGYAALANPASATATRSITSPHPPLRVWRNCRSVGYHTVSV